VTLYLKSLCYGDRGFGILCSGARRLLSSCNCEPILWKTTADRFSCPEYRFSTLGAVSYYRNISIWSAILHCVRSIVYSEVFARLPRRHLNICKRKQSKLVSEERRPVAIPTPA
jgi:hypothetical protein